MKRILLTGKNGQVGWELQRTLAPLGQVIAFDHNGLDLSDATRIRAVVREIRPDIIVNAAAYTAVDKAETEQKVAMLINGIAPGILAEEARQLGALLVHYSTDYVFDGTKNTPYTEDDKPNPINVYGHSKLLGEQAIQASDCRHLIFRTSWVYGLRGQNFLLTMLRLSREREELRIVSDQFGAPTWCRMIAETTACAILSNKMAQGVFHLSASGRTQWHEFASAILRQQNYPGRITAIPSLDYPLPAKRPTNSTLCNSSLFETFELQTPDWSQQLALCLAELSASC